MREAGQPQDRQESPPYETAPDESDTPLRRVWNGPIVTADSSTEAFGRYEDFSPAESNRLTALEYAPAFTQDAADQVVALLPESKSPQQEGALGTVAVAIYDTGGAPAAYRYAEKEVVRLDMRPSRALHVWTALYKAGDETALPEARRIAAYADPMVAVAVVEAGDLESAPDIRERARSCSGMTRTGIYSALYRAGDAASLDLALAAHAEVAADPYRGAYDEKALMHMVDAALDKDRLDEALKLASPLQDRFNQAWTHAKLFVAGHADSLSVVQRYLDIAPHLVRKTLERQMAAGGYPASVDQLRWRQAYAPWRSDISRLAGDDLEDLVALHKAGEPEMAQQVARLVYAYDDPSAFGQYLGKVGLEEQQEAYAAYAYEASPTMSNAKALLAFRHDDDIWRSLFNQYLSRGDTVNAAQLVRTFARHAKERAAGQ